MKTKLIFILAWLIVWCCWPTPPVWAAEKLALLIGIDDYSLSEGFSDLKGACHDVDLMHDVLEKRFGFDRITVLRNQEATHSRIAAAFQDLAIQAKSRHAGAVYIYYSGHGSRTLDLNGDETQVKDLHGNSLPSYDQSWVTYGSRPRPGAVIPKGFAPIDHYDILDDQIHQWLGDIAAHCSQLVFVSDSCHSGSVSRGGVITGTRGGPVDKRPHPLGNIAYPLQTLTNVITIGASKDSQIAREFIPENASDVFGVFTWFWSRALSKCNPDDSWSRIFYRVARTVDQQTPTPQVPQIAGAVMMKVFDADFSTQVPAIPILQVVPNPHGKEVYLAAGYLVGVTEGSIYTLENQVGRPNAPRLEIVRTYPTYSVAVTRAEVKPDDQLVETSHRHRFAPTRLLLKAENKVGANDALEEIRRIIAPLKSYEIVQEPQMCDLVVYLCPISPSPKTRKEPTAGTISSSIGMAATAEIRILDKNGALYRSHLKHAYTDQGLIALQRNLIQMARAKDLLALSSPRGQIPLQFSVVPMVPADRCNLDDPGYIRNEWPTDRCSASCYKHLDPLPLYRFLRTKWEPCTMLRFVARNTGDLPYYFYVVYVGQNSEVLPVFPSLEESAQVSEVAAGSESSAGKAFIRLDTQTLDQYKIIACKKPLNHHLFYQTPGAACVQRSEKDAAELNPLEKILMDAFAGTRSDVSYKTGDWYAETITIDMR